MKLILLLFGVLVAAVSTSHAQSLPKVEIFYETLNEPARQLFVEQYRQVFDSLNYKIELRLYPYGTTTKNGDNYVCGSDLQCEANKIHACLIKAEILTENPPNVDQPINQTLASQFVQCFFKNRFSMDDVEGLGNHCVPGDASSDWAEIRTCVLTDTTITAQFETASEPAKEELAKNGLAVRVDGVFADLTKTSLAGAICAKITDPKPDICTQATTPPTKVKVVIYYEAQSLDANKYLDKQVGNYYHVTEDFVDIDFVPYGTTVKTGETYNCTLGPLQCISNKFQALVVDKYITNAKGDLVHGQDRVVNFVQCIAQSTSGNELTTLEICSRNRLQVDDYRTFIKEIQLDTPEVKTVFERMRTQTEALVGVGNPLPRVPTVTVNGQLNYEALNDFVQETCYQQIWIGPKASICTKIEVIILYEPLNHKSRSFFLEQMNPVFQNMYTLLNLELKPAGRTIFLPGYGLTCPSGYDQCVAMQLQACAIDYFWNDGNNYTDPIRHEVFDFIVCTFKNRRMKNVIDAAEMCANDHIEADAWFTIHGCYQEGLGVDLVSDNIEYTQSLVSDMEHHEVPTVLINGTVVTDLTTIRKQICSFYDIYHQPDFCRSEAPSKVDVSIYYESTSELSKHFFTTQYDPWYIYIEEMANIKLYPAGNIRENLDDNGTCDSKEANSACMANKFMSLIIDKNLNYDDGDFIDGTLRTMLFHSCYYNHNDFKDNVYSAAEYCSQFLPNDDWFDLLVTAESPVGSDSYAKVLEATKKLASDNGLTDGLLTHIPWVTLNNKDFSRMAQNDLMPTVCQKYGGERPLECTPVEVTIYYSAYNAQSRRFFLDQLRVVYLHLRPRIHIQLVPYGVADASQTIESECSQNPNVCIANKAQACAIKKYYGDDVGENTVQWDGRNQTITFIDCMFKNVKNQVDVSKLIEDCANVDFILADEVTACVHQAEGLEYLSEMRNKTLEQFETMEHAPWIVINGLRSSIAQSDLKTAVCDAMLGDKPDFCYEITPPKVKVVLHYSAQNTKVQDYVISELYPHYRNLEEIVDLDVVPFGMMEIIGNGDGNYTTICEHGLNECRVNMIHGCLYREYYHNDDGPVSDNKEEYDGKLQFIEFLNCYFMSPNFPSDIIRAATECGEAQFGDAFGTALECAHSPLGLQILQEFEEKKVQTLLPHMTYVPWMTVDDKHSYTIEHHIQRTLCDSYTGKEKPLDCFQIYDSDFKPAVEVHYEPGDVGSKFFFTSSLMPHHVFEIGQIKLVPFGRSTYTDTTKKCIGDETCGKYKEHACLIDTYMESHLVLTLSTVACTFGDVIGDSDALNECVNQIFGESVADPMRPIDSCLKNGTAEQLMTEYANLVSGLTPNISHVPWILVEGEHNVEAEVSLCNELCSSYYPADKPTLCRPALLPVAVYYETKNPDVAGMMLSVAEYREYLDEMGNFSFIPYGTTKNDNGVLSCPVDENQCHANKVHACVLNRFYNESVVNHDYEKNRIRTASFITCTFFQMLGSSDAVEDAEVCLQQNFDSLDLWPDINGNCVPSLEGKELMEEMRRKTEALSDPKLTTAPYVTIGGKYNEAAQVNLIQALCDAYPMVKAPLCATLPNFAVKVGIYFSGNEASKKLFNEQILPFYKEIVPVLRREGTSESKLHSLISPEIVAWGNTKYDASNTENPFTCEGEKECYINRFFTCATHFHGTEPRATLHLIELALCFFQNENALTDPAEVFNICVDHIWLIDPFVELEVCATQNTQEMIDIFLKAKEKTENNSPILTSFPSITINNILNEGASSNLLGAACANYQGNNPPEECSSVVQPTTLPPTNLPSSTLPSTTPETPGGAGTVPAVSVLVFLFSFLLSFLLL